MDIKNLLTRSRNLLSHPPLWWKENEASRERLIGELDAAIHQEPVAWMYQTKSGFRKCWHFGEQSYPAFIADRAAASEFPEGHSWTPLYTCEVLRQADPGCSMTDKLPPLPDPIWGYSTSTPKFSADQMHAYARAALQALEDEAEASIKEMIDKGLGQVQPVAWQAIGGSIWNHKTREDDRPLYATPQPTPAQSRKAYGFESRPAHHSGLVKEIDMNPTGEQPKMMQDESRELSRWLSTTPDALSHAKEAADIIITDASIESSLRMLKADKEQS